MQNLKLILDQLNIPVAYDHFNTPISPPFVAFRRYSQDNYGADNVVFKKINRYYIELYTEYKDVVLENALEDILTDNDIFYNVESETYIDTEQMYEVVYSINYNDTDIASI